MTSWTILIPAPTKWMNANQRHGHWSERSGPTKLWRDAAKVLAHQARIPALDRVTITATVHRPDRRRNADAHNRYPTVKAVVDGLVDAGVLPDDCDRHLVSLTIQAGASVDKRRYPLGVLELTITTTETGGRNGEQMGRDQGGSQEQPAIPGEVDHADAR